MSNPSPPVSKLWNYCNILRDDGLSYGDYVEQLTFLLLKMADKQSVDVPVELSDTQWYRNESKRSMNCFPGRWESNRVTFVSSVM